MSGSPRCPARTRGVAAYSYRTPRVPERQSQSVGDDTGFEALAKGALTSRLKSPVPQLWSQGVSEASQTNRDRYYSFAV